ncbi:AMP-dependent synthetase and ligase [Novosphingobium aromaticivorans DSM 12444]|uniref:AMP-dependent synthetase and ligase n=1 Tax=Novosphingobium aromaticivorans (strain ATCC 700278 / DSM 12444 / CCUG 56034 / CIP 105152 / NBRC 16084 / F199) TaxID=279238 RepID=Q2G8B0_NOVAD|nr:class I adenylate-forming enzyme family protein [Novosphingobium aromaticivorans]ABD25913.1 AMP-dependent synthetase and ligase [Novosphingobium aromaticivorans DSM 12444]SCY97184.1 fatty-acyl-CoA synthase [Novosphingobium aromaticivorans]
MPVTVTTEVATVGDLLLRAADLHAERTALALPGVAVSYRELRDGAFRVARALIGLGIARGEHVALLMPNSVEFAEALFGIMLAGCVAVPLNARHRAAEIGYIIDNSQARILLTSRHDSDPVNFIEVIEQALPTPSAAPALRYVALLRGEGSGDVLGREAFLSQGVRTDPAEVEHTRRSVRVRDAALIIYTSGTTANPKGCVLPHEAVTRGPVERARYRLSANGVDVTWAGGPLFHIGSLAPFIGSVGVAGTFLADSYFEPGRAIALMEKHAVTLAWPWFAAIVQGIIDHPEFSAEKFAHLKYLFLIAPPTLVERVQDLLPHTEIIQACGMTETSGVFALCDTDEDRESRIFTQGKACPGIEIRIVDPETGQDLPDGTMGEILVRGYNVMDGYWDAPEKTSEALVGHGWLKTGDLYTRQPNGSLIFGGRCKDMLKVGGENVAAIEVEAFLCTHPAVKTAEVVGRPDPRLDEVPVAFIELYDGETINEEELIAFCRGRIASYKVPRAIRFMSAADWPMSATKIDKRALRAQL